MIKNNFHPQFKWIRRIVFGASIALSTMAWATPEESYQIGLKAFLENDLLVAMEHLRTAAKEGHPQAIILLAELLDQAEEDKDALTWYKKAAEAGDAEGMFGYGRMLVQGEGEKNPKLGMEWLNKAVSAGHLSAMLMVGKAYCNGSHGLAKDEKKGLELVIQAADKNLPAAMRDLVTIYTQGMGKIAPDPQKAKEWADKLAKGKNP